MLREVHREALEERVVSLDVVADPQSSYDLLLVGFAEAKVGGLSESRALITAVPIRCPYSGSVALNGLSSQFRCTFMGKSFLKYVLYLLDSVTLKMSVAWNDHRA